MNGVILYKSKYGATKKYAEWIAEETGFSMVKTTRAKIDEIRDYDVIILGGGIYASGIAGLSFLRKHWESLHGKKIIVFCDGASPYEEKAFQKIVAHNMKDQLRGIPCFYCRGAWDLQAMHFLDRNLCKMLQKAVAKKDPSAWAGWEKALMDAGDDRRDWTDRKYIEPILKAIQK